MKTALHDLAELGQSPWLAGAGRGDLLNGGLVDLVGRGVRGLTTDPAMLRTAIAECGEEHRQVQREVLSRTADTKQAYLELAIRGARQACMTLEGAIPEPGPRDAWVSLEVDPRFAHDVRSTVEEAVLLHQAVNHPRFCVKIPGTVQGLAAIEEATALGVRVDVTLLFSVFRHRQAAEAYLRGLRRLRDSGGSLRGMFSVASFCVSRLDTVGDEALRAVGGDQRLAGRLAIANAKIAYRTYKEVFTGMRWDELAGAGAAPQSCLWAMTAPEDPTVSDVKYVEGLIGPETITSMTREGIEAFVDHGRVALTLEDDAGAGAGQFEVGQFEVGEFGAGESEAEAVLEGFRRAGVDYDTLAGHLEKTGIREAGWSFAEMLRDLEAVRGGI